MFTRISRKNICEINVPAIALSDHYPVCITRRFFTSLLRKNNHIEIKYRDCKNFDDSLFLNDMFNENFDAVKQIEDPNEIMDKFYSIFLKVLNKHSKAKSKRVKRQFKPTWLTPDIQEARYNRDYHHKKKDAVNYKYWRNKVTELMKNSKEQYYKNRYWRKIKNSKRHLETP